MNLVSQWLWLGLLTLPAILILHLLRERSKRQPISSLELWRWLEKELRGPRLRRLPVTWILLLQLLAALGLNVALSRPQLSWAQLRPAQQHLIVVVDTSGSMAARDVPPSRLAQAQAAAAARLAALGETDRATLITAGPAARQLASAGADSLNELVGRLAGLQAGGDGSDWAGALALAAAAIEPGLTNRILLYTDGAFQTSSTLEAASFPAEVELHVVGQPQANQAVVTLAVRPSASGAVQVFARVANFADAPVERALTLAADGSDRDQLVVSLPPSGVSDQAWTLPPGVRTVAVTLAGGDVMPADDTAAVGVLGSGTLRGVLVTPDPEAEGTLVLERALRSLPNLDLTTVTPDHYAAYENYDLSVFSGWLPEAWPRGGVLVLAPPEGRGLLAAQTPTTVNTLTPNAGGDLLADVDLGHVDFGRAAALAEAPDWLTPVLTDELGLSLIWHGTTGSSRVVVFTFSPAGGNLARRTAFPVLMANAVAEVLPPPLPAAVGVGEPVDLPPAHTLPFLTITDPAGDEHNFSSERAPAFTETFQPGLYQLRGRTVAGHDWQGGFGVNAGSALESDLRLSAQPALSALTGTSALPPVEANPPLDLWPWLVLLVLLIMVVEAALAWR